MVRRSAVILAAMMSALMAGCSNNPTPTPSPSTTTAPTVTPEEVARAEATKAYVAAYKRVNQMGEQPHARLADYPTSWAITDYLADPFLTQIVTSYAQFKKDGVGVRDPHVEMTPKVSKVDLSSATKTVTMTYCPTYKTRLFSLETNKDVSWQKPAGTADLPWLVTSTMTKVGATWKLTNDSLDSKRTCTPG